MNVVLTKRKPDLCDPTLIGFSMSLVYRNQLLKSREKEKK